MEGIRMERTWNRSKREEEGRVLVLVLVLEIAVIWIGKVNGRRLEMRGPRL